MILGYYKDKLGARFRAIAFAINESTVIPDDIVMVVYHPVDNKNSIFVRTEKDFAEMFVKD